MFPADDILIARGKVATLRKERRQQIERLQAVCGTIISTASGVLKECQEDVQDKPQNIVTLAKCVENITEARDRIITLNLGIAELKEEAWG